MKHRIVLDSPVGGLGDSLLFSTLPELYTKAGYPFYLSKTTTTRNAQVWDLLYDRNPYIKGVCAFADETPNAGQVFQETFLQNARHFASPITLVEELHVFRTGNIRPKVYYKPKIREDVSDKYVCDFRSISQGFPNDVIERFITHLGLPKAQMIVLTSPYSGRSGAGALSDVAQYEVKDILEYCDLIYSCKSFITVESGGHALAAALRYDGIYALVTTLSMNARFFIFPGVLYTVASNLQPDYYPNGTQLGMKLPRFA